MIDVQKIIDQILMKEIHHEERYPSKWKYYEKAETLILVKHEPYEGDCSYILYRNLASSIEYMEGLILVIMDLKKRGTWDSVQSGVKLEDYYYEEYFARIIDRYKRIMNKLRPYIKEYTKNWSFERKMSDVKNEQIGKYFKNWFSNT